jgi:hypothetical protein
MENEMKQKKEYVAPEMEEIRLNFGACLLQNSEESDEPNSWGGELD